MRVIITDNYNRDYQEESFINIPVINDTEKAKAIADALNAAYPEDCPWYYRVVENNYELEKTFEP